MIFCCYCGKAIKYPMKLTNEHLIPVSKGGNNSNANKRPCCHICNGSRGNKDFDVWKRDLQNMITNRASHLRYRTLYDLEIMIENIEWIKDYVENNKIYLLKRSARIDLPTVQECDATSNDKN